MPSVVLTYQKVIVLTSRYFWFILGLTLTTRLLESCLSVRGPSPHHNSRLALLEITVLIASAVLGAASAAALLGILREPKQAGLRLMWTSVRSQTWVLFRLFFLLGLIALAAMIPFLFLIRLLHPSGVIAFAIAFVYLVLIKYALSYPLAVDEHLTARQALKRSWVMTRGHFWYVISCYLVLAFAHMIVIQLFASPWLDANVPLSFSYFLRHAVDGFFDSLWIVLGWQMYVEIKSADTPSLPARAEWLSAYPGNK
jgi:hypothetical protein